MAYQAGLPEEARNQYVVKVIVQKYQRLSKVEIPCSKAGT